ncbi:methionyl-tRNA formyltransferase [bacterium]|nr:methionyl-tRNA formyltransferase [bacterium]
MGPSSTNHQRPLLLISSRPWNSALANRLSRQLNRPVESIAEPTKLTSEAVAAIDPQWIFVPHWSHLIPESIWGFWPTVIFHMTDLPYGRGGSPLQNLILRGHSSTMLSALRCGAGLDAGGIYSRQPLSLHGSAEEIFLRADGIIEQMIEQIVREEPAAVPQQGEPVLFSRRTPAQSNLASCPEGDLSSWYDQIRMLDAEGYPYAFLETHGMRLEFRRVSQRSDGLHADVKIMPIPPS